MKKILVVSDNHFQAEPLTDILSRHNDVDFFVHCGDSQWQPDAALLQKFIAVRGNNDFVPLPEVEQFVVEECNVLVSHGHQQNVYHTSNEQNIVGTDELVTYALEVYNANVVFYGHTHVAEMHIDRGVFVLNPGSLNFPRGLSFRTPTYAIVSVDGIEVQAKFYDAKTGTDVTEQI